jgi:hypothetical protein
VSASGLRILVLGYLVRGPLAGFAWHHLQYVLGLQRLGHDVYFLEDSDDYPSCYDPDRDVTDADPSYGLRFAARAFESLEIGPRFAYHDAHSSRWLGPCARRVGELWRTADLLLNLSCAGPLRPWLLETPVRVLIDTDPAFTQIEHLTDEDARELARHHTAFFSFGENIQDGRSAIPEDGFPWRATRQPVVLDAWPVTPGPILGKFSTVMQWDSYTAREHGGVRYGMKSDSFRDYLDLPQRAGRVFDLAVGSTPDVRRWLAGRGWGVRDSRGPTRDLAAYQRFIGRSKAEFSVAKQGYVTSRSGWFSERSTGYLASGRPVITQDTGFSAWLPTGAGVLAFDTPDAALAAIDELDAGYAAHCRDAREVAEEHFDSRKVLGRLVEEAMSAA